MTITITEKESNGKVYKNIKFSRQTMPAEYIIVEKVYEEPQDGTSQYGKWYNYLFLLKERKTLDEKTLQVVHDKEVCEASMFVTEKLNELIKDIKVNTPFKIFKEIKTGAKGEYSVYAMQMVEDDEKSSNMPNGWLETAKFLLANGTPKAEVAEQIAKDNELPIEKVLNELNDLPE